MFNFTTIVLALITIFISTSFITTGISQEKSDEILHTENDLLQEKVDITRTDTQEFHEDGLSPHKENFILPFTWSKHRNASINADQKERKGNETIFQLSVKQKILTSFSHAFYIGYTQKSFWQVYDEKDSRPFRETNYNPEVFARSGFSLFGFSTEKVFYDLGFEHESNGQVEPITRSWNRFYFTPRYSGNNFDFSVKLWYRLPETESDSTSDHGRDENPEIINYYGNGEITGKFKWEVLGKIHQISVFIRHHFPTDRGALNIKYSLPMHNKNFDALLYYWNGYGESLIDYDRHITKFGIGMQFSR